MRRRTGSYAVQFVIFAAILLQFGCAGVLIQSQKVVATDIRVPALDTPAVQDQNCLLIHAILHSDRNGPETIFTFRARWPEDCGQRLFASSHGRKVSIKIDKVEVVKDSAQAGRDTLRITGDYTYSLGMPSLWGWSSGYRINQKGGLSPSQGIVEYHVGDKRYGLAIVITPVNKYDSLARTVPFGTWIAEHWDTNLSRQVFTFCGGYQPNADRNHSQWERVAQRPLTKLSEAEYQKPRF